MGFILGENINNGQKILWNWKWYKVENKDNEWISIWKDKI